MRVWITGANGFVGKNFARHVRSLHGHIDLVGLDIGKCADTELDRYVSVDVGNAEDVVRYAQSYPPTHVLHCAASIFESNADELWRVNVRGTAVLIDSLHRAGLGDVRIVCIGSAAEYASAGNGIISETSDVGPVSEYGRSKLAQSLLALSFARAFGQEVIVARTFNLIGPGTSEQLVPGAMLKKLKTASSRTMAVSDAYSSRDFVDIRDAVAAYWELLNKGKENNVYNVCYGSSTTIAELAEKFVENLAGKSSVEIKIDYMDKKRARHVLGSNEKIRQDTGWTPSISIDRSVADMLKEAGL